MSQPTAPPTPNAISPRRRRRWRIVLSVLVLLIVVPFLFWGYTVESTRQAWAAAEAEAALDIPHWRLLELEADRADIPDAENSALHAIAVRRMPVDPSHFIRPEYDQVFAKLPPNAQLNKQQSDLVRGELAKVAKPLAEARKLKDMPRGRFPIDYGDDYFITQVPELQASRTLAHWLQHDAMQLSQDKEYDKAVESCQAILNMGRAFDGDPMLIGYLVQVALQSIAVAAVERVLAQGQASEAHLQAFQVFLDKDIKSNCFLQAVRGERGGSHHTFENLRTGKIVWPELGWFSVRKGAGVAESARNWVIEKYPTTLLKYCPEYLRHMNRGVEIAKLPDHEREAKFNEWASDGMKTGNPVIRFFGPGMSKVSAAESRKQAYLRTAMVALACERYRLKHKKIGDENPWPASLETLVKEGLLEAVPLDPMDGQPLRYRRTKEGIVVYSIGIDMIDNQGHVDPEHPFGQPGVDMGFRLWDVNKRRQNPLPPVAIPE